MRREYPPMLSGKPEDQIAQLRAYLVRLTGYIDEALREVPTDGTSSNALAALAEWQKGVNNSIDALRAAVKDMPLIQFGAVNTTTGVVFDKPYPDKPAVFATAGTISAVSETGFTLTTTGAAQWIAVGRR